ncbi:MAG: protein translocase subunit SecF, partial [Flexistipes sinusarabici]
LPIIAAVLTIVGYSLNDTIVVFDRIRETIKASGGKKIPLKELMNTSINQTLSRTLLTSLTTLLAVLSLYIFGGEVIHGFAFALLIGIVIGTYSSIGVASSLVFFYKEYKVQNKETG